MNFKRYQFLRSTALQKLRALDELHKVHTEAHKDAHNNAHKGAHNDAYKEAHNDALNNAHKEPVQGEDIQNHSVFKTSVNTTPAEGNINSIDSLLLAYIGDGVYSLYIRDRVAMTGITKVQVLHNLVTDFICAKSQAKVFLHLEPLFTEEESMVAKRARNSQVNVPKNVDVYEYRLSTAFEAVLGYLYNRKDHERLSTLMNASFSYVLETLR